MTAIATAPKSIKGKKSKDDLNQDEKFPLTDLSAIKIAERPEPGKESDCIFFNPRSMDSFVQEEMQSLMDSIAEDGLQQPPVCRAFTVAGVRDAEIIRIELIAGERRLRTLQEMYRLDIPCKREDGSATTAQDLYAKIPVKMYYNISDEKALRIAFAENHEHQKLTIKEEVSLVERLAARGLSQAEIVGILGTNVTWVSQTANFREELPIEAFQKLIEGKLSRHVAVKMLSYKKEDRETLYTETVRVQKEEFEATKAKLEQERFEAEDEEEIAASKEQEAIDKANAAEAKRQERKRRQAQKKQEEVKEKETRLDDEKDTIRQGHLQKGGQQAGIVPKKATALTKQMIQQFYVELLGKWIENGKIDSVTKKTYPTDMLETVRNVAQAMLSGDHDPGKVIRTMLVARGEWTLPEGYEEKAVELLEVAEGDEPLE